MKTGNLLHVVILLITLICFVADHTNAQSRHINDPALLEVYREIADMGPTLNLQVVQRTVDLFVSLHENSDMDGVNAFRNLNYGPDPERHLLDVYTPEDADGRRPVIVFIHGGGLTSGHKDNEVSDLMYANIGIYFARNDLVGINATYRLVPNIIYPQGGEDMKAIVKWIRDNSDEYGIDPEQIFFLCASAGCTHVASLLFDLDMMDDATPDIAGAIMLSGAYEGYNQEYYGTNADIMRSNTPLGLAQAYEGIPVPILLMSAEYDPTPIKMSTIRLLLTLCEKRNSCPGYIQAKDHNHISINRHINTSDERYTQQMLEFIRKVTGIDKKAP